MPRPIKDYTQKPKCIKELYEIYMSKEDAAISDVQGIEEIQYIIQNELTIPEQQIILLYADLGSVRHLATHIKCSYSKTYRIIKSIQDKIKCSYRLH